MASFRNNTQQIVVTPLYNQDGLKIERVRRFDHMALLPDVARWRSWSFRITLSGTRYVKYQEQTYTLAPNTIFWTSPLKEDVRTRSLPGTGSDMVVCTWSSQRWSQFIEQHHTFAGNNRAALETYPQQPLLALHVAPPQIIYVVRQFIALCQKPEVSRLALENQCTLLLQLMSSLRFSAPASRYNAEQRQRVEAAQKRMVEHLPQAIGLQQLAADLNVSARQLQRDFVACTGLTPLRYLNVMRLSEANTLLAETTTPIAEIAATLGYSSLTHFSAAFRQMYNCSPRQMREAIQRGAGEDSRESANFCE